MPYGRWALAGSVLVVVTAIHLVNFAAPGNGVEFLDSTSLFSYPHLLATFAYAAGVLAGAIGASAGRDSRTEWRWIGVSFAVLLVDHVTRVHDRVPGGVLLFVPFLAIGSMAGLAVAAGTRLSRPAWAGVALLAIALALHVALRRYTATTPWPPEHYTTEWWYQILGGLKEAIELTGWVLFAPVLVALARASAGRRAAYAPQR